MQEIVVVALFSLMIAVTRSVIAENGYTNVGIVEGNLQQGLEVARSAIDDCVKVINPRGGTYEGNVRELRGMIERAIVVCEGNTIAVDDLGVMPPTQKREPADACTLTFFDGQTLCGMEESYIDYVY